MTQAPPLEIDTIQNFRRGQDKIDLSTIDADDTVIGNQKFNYIGTHDSTGALRELRFQDGMLLGDCLGDERPDILITVTGVTALGAADIIL